jgi:iron complex transport system substrate-binding protein
MEPVGEVTFERVPETWVANNGSWADMGVALGREPPMGVWLPSRYHTHHYDEIPGLSVDTSDVTRLWGSAGVSKEQFYDLDADVHVIDPNFLVGRSKNWERADVEELAERVAPFFGNSIFSGGYSWHDDYRYYTLYEAFEKLARVFRRTERYEAFASLHEEFQSAVDDVVPSSGDRPAVAIMWAGGNEPEEFSPYLISQGTSFKQWRDLGVRDALAETDVQDFHQTRAAVDYETLLEIDPEHLMFRGHEGQTESEFRNTLVAFLEDHDVASQLTAVRNGDVYRGGPLYQGPITNLVVTERAAKQVYGVDEQLFDRQRVAEIVAGDL